MFKTDDIFKQSFTVSDSVYEGFINIFKDKNPLHTDEQFAVSHGFKERVVHGNILNGFLSYFVGECLPAKDVIIHSQEIEFKKPVYLNDVLSFEAKITGIYDSVKAVEFKFTFRNQEAELVSKGKIQIGLLR